MQHRIALFAALLPAVVACGRIERQAGALLGLVDDHTSDRNAYLMFSESAIEDMIRESVDESREVNDTVNDVNVQLSLIHI